MGEQSKPRGRPWPVSPELASRGPACRPVCPEDARHGWQLSESTRSPSGGSCPDALQINSVSPACTPPHNCSGGPTGGWHSMLPVRWLPVLSRYAGVCWPARLPLHPPGPRGLSGPGPPRACFSTVRVLPRPCASPLQGDRGHCGRSGCRWTSASCCQSGSPTSSCWLPGREWPGLLLTQAALSCRPLPGY